MTYYAPAITAAIALLVLAVFAALKRFGSPLGGGVGLDVYPARLAGPEESYLEREEAKALRAEEHRKTKCLRCDEKATHAAPRIEGIPLADWPLIGGIIGFFWRMFSLSPLYHVVEANEDPTFCSWHVGEEFAAFENECAQLRAASSSFLLDQHRRVATKNRSVGRQSVEARFGSAGS